MTPLPNPFVKAWVESWDGPIGVTVWPVQLSAKALELRILFAEFPRECPDVSTPWHGEPRAPSPFPRKGDEGPGDP